MLNAFAGLKKVTVNRYNQLQAFEQVLLESYDRVPLNLVGYKYCKMDKGKRLALLDPQPTTIGQIEAAIGRGKLILLPLRDLPLPPPLPVQVPVY